MEILGLKSVAILLTRYYTFQKLSGLSNEILSILVVQGNAKLRKVKVEGPKKNTLLIANLGQFIKKVESNPKR